MLNATALPITGTACFNPRMLQGTELAAAIVTAMEKKRALPGWEKLGPTALGRGLGMAQGSASELLKTGRLAKEKLPILLAFFEDVVGPDHFGLPISGFEMRFLKALRALPGDAQSELLARVQKSGEAVRAATAELMQAPADAGVAAADRQAALAAYSRKAQTHGAR